MNELAVVVLGVCFASVVVNFVILTLNVKLYTEFAKERFRGRE